MARLRKLSTGAWIAVGLVVGLVLAPAGAIAATNLVGIVASNGARASVTAAGQLRVAEASPTSFRELKAFSTTGCARLIKVPANDGFIVKSVTFDTFDDPTPGGSNFASVYLGAGCNENQELALVNPGSVGSTTVPLDPGFAVPPNGILTYNVVGNVGADVYVTGYLVPKADVGSGTHVPMVVGLSGAGRRG
jgi:hypothetical protein